MAENFDLASWAKEIREVRFSSLRFKRRPFPPVVMGMWIVFVLSALSSALYIFIAFKGRRALVLYVLRPSLWRDEISDETLARTSLEDG